MKIEKILIILVLLTLVALLASVRISEYLEGLKNPPQTKVVQPEAKEEAKVTKEEPKEEESALKFDRKEGSMDPSFNYAIKLALSTDGKTFTPDSVVLDKTSKPDVVVLADGKLAIYSNDLSGRSNSGIMVSLSEDGKTWQSGSVKINSLRQMVVDPDVVLTSDGRIRMYFVQVEDVGLKTVEPTNTVLSAVSSDGINFRLETGERFEDMSIRDPDVFKIEDTWYMYLSKGVNTVTASSEDGLDFEVIGSDRVKVASSSTIKVGDIYRQFYCFNGVKSATSSDGLTWRNEVGNRLPNPADEDRCDPSVLNIEGDNWLMYYTSKTAREETDEEP